MGKSPKCSAPYFLPTYLCLPRCRDWESLEAVSLLGNLGLPSLRQKRSVTPLDDRHESIPTVFNESCTGWTPHSPRSALAAILTRTTTLLGDLGNTIVLRLWELSQSARTRCKGHVILSSLGLSCVCCCANPVILSSSLLRPSFFILTRDCRLRSGLSQLEVLPSA